LEAFKIGGLILRYGYIMEHTVHKYTYSLGPVTLFPGADPVPVPDLILVTETKQRQRANPFGFGLKWDDLSPFQLSILTALGISRS